MTLRNRAHAQRVLALVTEARSEHPRATSLESDLHRATMQWLRAVAENKRYGEEDRVSACEVRLALESSGYAPTRSAQVWLRKQAARPAKFLASRWARHALTRLELEP